MFYKKGVLENFAKFTEKHLCQCLFFDKVAGLRTGTLLKKRPRHRCFLVNFAKFFCKHLFLLLRNRILSGQYILAYRYAYWHESLRKKCLYSELFRSAFSRIRTEYGEILRISPYLVQMQENTDQNNSE